jgi:AcrR family transcriptional regulator
MSTAGPCNVTFGTVARRAQISKSGIFAHFDSMDGLKIGILDQAMNLWRSTCLDSGAGVAVGLPRLAHYLNRWMGWTVRAGLPGACPIASAIFELDYLPGTVREAVTTIESTWRSTLVQLVDSSIANRDLVKTTDSHQIAWDLFGTYLTHHLSMHFLHDPDADRRAALAVDRLIVSAGGSGWPQTPEVSI